MPSKKSTVNNILGVSDGSSTFAEREHSGKVEEAEQEQQSEHDTIGDSEEVAKQTQRAQQQTTKSEKQSTEHGESPEADNTETTTPQRRSSSQRERKTPELSDFELDTGVEQTAKASYYLSPKQTKRLDDLRTAFRHEANYAPRDASYSRIVGLAIDRLYEEVFSS